MPRPKKTADKAGVVPMPLPVPVAPPPMMAAPQNIPPPGAPINLAAVGAPIPRVIDNESFLRVRDSAVGRLTTILELLRSFTADYIRQTNLLLGEHTAEGAPQDVLASFDNAAAQLMMPVPDMTAAPEEKKERKKRTHDPNAPKRPLTPYFLYMQHARSIIANDLGPEAPKGAVQEEGQRRWANMSPTEKQGWNNAYQYNLRLYNARTHSYKAGNVLAKGMSDEDALKYAEEFSIAMPDAKDAAAEAQNNEQDAIAQQLQQQVATAPAIGGDEDSTKTPKKTPASRKRKTATPSAADISTGTPVAAGAAPASPDKKRRRSTKAGDDSAEPKKAARGKKTKSS
jgi:hypothetical protein